MREHEGKRESKREKKKAREGGRLCEDTCVLYRDMGGGQRTACAPTGGAPERERERERERDREREEKTLSLALSGCDHILHMQYIKMINSSSSHIQTCNL